MEPHREDEETGSWAVGRLKGNEGRGKAQAVWRLHRHTCCSSAGGSVCGGGVSGTAQQLVGVHAWLLSL